MAIGSKREDPLDASSRNVDARLPILAPSAHDFWPDDRGSRGPLCGALTAPALYHVGGRR